MFEPIVASTRESSRHLAEQSVQHDGDGETGGRQPLTGELTRNPTAGAKKLGVRGEQPVLILELEPQWDQSSRFSCKNFDSWSAISRLFRSEKGKCVLPRILASGQA